MRACCLALFAAFVPAAIAQTSPDLTALLRKVSDTYTANTKTQYEVVADLTTKSDDTGQPVKGHMRFAYHAAGRYRMEGALPGLKLDPAFEGNLMIVHDGTVIWFYVEKNNQYTSIPASTLANAGGDMGDLAPEVMDHFMMFRYRGASGFTGRKFLREEAMDYEGGKVNCYVVSVSGLEEAGDSPLTWWIDPKRFLVLREDREENSSVFTSIRLGGPLADDLFKFQPPPGAKKIQ